MKSCKPSLTFAVALIVALNLFAQEEMGDDFGFGDDTAFDAETFDVPVDPTPAVAPVVNNEQDADLAAAQIVSPAVNEVILSNPTTPDELLRAVDILVKLDRSDLAKDYLQKLIDLQLDKVALANLHRRVGSGIFVQLSRARDLNPQAAEFARTALMAAREMQQDPNRLASIIEQLETADSKQHRRLARELIKAGPVAVIPMIQSIAANPKDDIAPLLRTAVAAIREPAVGPLLAFLDSGNEMERIEAIKILGHMREDRALPFLARSFVSSNQRERQAARAAIRRISNREPRLDDVVALTKKIASDRYRGLITTTVGSDDLTDAWLWNEELKAPVRERHFPRDVALFEAARHYHTLSEIDSLNIDSLNNEHKLRFLIAAADAAKVQGGLDAPVSKDDSFLQATMSTESHNLSRAYRMAMADGHIPAMIGLAEAIGHRGDNNTFLAGTEGRPSPLVSGVTHANPRVRFAAVDAIAKLGPTHAFAGNSRVVEALAHFGSSKGRRAALVAHPRAEVASTIAGLLNKYGFDADVALTSKELLRRATETSDYEFFFVSDAFDRPDTHQVVQLLRQNPLSARIPIGIMARSPEHSDANMIAELHPKIITLPDSTIPETIARAVTRITAIAGPDVVPAERRAEMAYVALTHLSELTKANQLPGTDLSRFVAQIKRPSTTRGLALKSIEVLGRIASPDAQARLLDITNQHLLSFEQRAKAAEAFDDSVHRFGLLLTKRQVLTQYDVYNSSESLDPPTQQLLGAVLDTIENPLEN